MGQPASKFLAVHLNDHLAAATATLELARRVAGQYPGAELGAFAEGLAERLAGDRRAIEDLLRRFAVRRDRAKEAVAWAGEKAGRLKLNGQVRGSSPLSPLVEAEGLLIGLEATGLLWRNLAAVADDLGLDAAGFEASLDRLGRDRAELDRIRERLAIDALRNH